jgi:hypothetical protein
LAKSLGPNDSPTERVDFVCAESRLCNPVRRHRIRTAKYIFKSFIVKKLKRKENTYSIMGLFGDRLGFFSENVSLKGFKKRFKVAMLLDVQF